MKSIQHGITGTSYDVNDLNIIHSFIERKLRMKSCIKNKLSTRVKRLHGYCMSRSRAIIKRDLLKIFLAITNISEILNGIGVVGFGLT